MDPIKTFEAYMKTAEAAKKLNQSSPVPWPPKDRISEMMTFQMRRLHIAQINSASNAGKVKGNTTILSSDVYTCKTSFDNLKPIKLRDMMVPKHHEGYYLVCQVVCVPIVIAAVATLIEDLNGDIEELSLYNFAYDLRNADWLKPGDVLVIKEPWLRYAAQSKKPSLRVDSPSDIIFVDPTDYEFLKKLGAERFYDHSFEADLDMTRMQANKTFKKRDYRNALMFCNRAIRINPDLGQLYLNKSMLCIQMEKFYEAYGAAKLGLEKGGDRENGLYRLGLAAYGMRDWKLAANHFVEVLKDFPQYTSASEQLKRATSRLKEQTTGKFDFKAMYLKSLKENPQIDVADYKGPIEITNIKGKGRGIIATEDIKRGTLLAVSKAFSSGYDKDFPDFLLTVNMMRLASGTAAQMLLTTKAMLNVQNNPQRAKEIYDLYAGDMPLEEEYLEGVVDAARIQQICSRNAFGLDRDTLEDIFSKGSSRLYVLPSYFNHSCIANSDGRNYEDVMVIHANIDIKKGEEIFLNYCDSFVEFDERTTKLNHGWNFTCQCELCKIESQDKNCAKQTQVLNDFHDYAKANNHYPKRVVTKGEKILKEIRKLNRHNSKPYLVRLLVILAQFYHRLGNFTKSIKYLEEAISLMNDKLTSMFDISRYLIDLARSYLAKGDIDKANETFDKAYQMSFYPDKDHFKMLYKVTEF